MHAFLVPSRDKEIYASHVLSVARHVKAKLIHAPVVISLTSLPSQKWIA